MSKINVAKTAQAMVKETKNGKKSKVMVQNKSAEVSKIKSADKSANKNGSASAKIKVALKPLAKSVPAKPVVKPAVKLVAKPATKPAPKPAPKPVAKSAAKPASAKAAPVKTVTPQAKPVTAKIVVAKTASAPMKPVTTKIVATKAATVPAKPAPAKPAPAKSVALVAKSAPTKPTAAAEKTVQTVVKAVAVKAAPVVEKSTKAVAKVTPVAPVITYKCPFPPDELAKWRQILLTRRHEITNDIAGLVKDAIDAEDGHTTPNHLAERGSDADLQDLSLGVAGDEKDIVWQIDRALRKIEMNRPLPFGLCEYNKTPIPRTRLQLIPFAPLSIEGATHMEQNSLMMEDLLIED